MHLRKSLVAVAAALAVGLLGLSSSAYATIGAASGPFSNSGSITIAGSTWYCNYGGTIGGSYDNINNPAFTFTTMSVGCITPVAVATISLNSCAVPVYLTTGRTAGVDTAVTGTADFGTSTCVQIKNLSGYCTIYVQGTVNATFNENVSGGYQDLVLNSPAGGNPAQCSGFPATTIALNNLRFRIAGSPGPINFS